MEKKEKQSFAPWLENIWYHYKWRILIIGMVLVFVIIGTVQIFSHKKPDVNILYVDRMYYSDLEADVRATVNRLSEDHNGNGSVDTDLLTITVTELSDTSTGETFNYDRYNSDLQRFQVEIRTGDAYIYILDPEYFDICVSENVLARLEDVLDTSTIPAGSFSEYGIRLSDLEAYSLPGFCRMEENAILCLRRTPLEDPLAYGRDPKDWEGNRKTFINIINYTAEKAE